MFWTVRGPGSAHARPVNLGPVVAALAACGDDGGMVDPPDSALPDATVDSSDAVELVGPWAVEVEAAYTATWADTRMVNGAIVIE